MIEIERLSEDRLSRQLWQFIPTASWAHDKIRVELRHYSTQTRFTTRHKFKGTNKNQWSAVDQRSYFSGIKAADVPLPEDVRQEARTKAIALIVIIGAEAR